MSDTVNVVAIPAEIVINRNSVDVRFIPTAFKRGKKAEAGETYPAIDPAISFTNLVQYWGEEEAKAELLARANLRSQGWHESATTSVDDAGNEIAKPFDLAEFTKYAQEFSARGLSKDELIENIKTGTDELYALLTDPSVDGAVKAAKAITMSLRIKNLNAALAARKRKKEDEAAPVAA